jgi:hypothetical protein
LAALLIHSAKMGAGLDPFAVDNAEQKIRTNLAVSHFCRPYEAHDFVQ